MGVPLFELTTHVVTFLTILLPSYFLYRMMQRKSEGEFQKAFLLVFFGLFAVALGHLVEASELFGVEFPPGTVFIYEHASIILLSLILAWLFAWFDKNYVEPFYRRK